MWLILACTLFGFVGGIVGAIGALTIHALLTPWWAKGNRRR